VISIKAGAKALAKKIAALKSLRTLQPSQSFFTLLLTFMPLDCSVFLLRSTSNTGLLQRCPKVLLRLCHENALIELNEWWLWSIDLVGILGVFWSRAVPRIGWKSDTALLKDRKGSMAGDWKVMGRFTKAYVS